MVSDWDTLQVISQEVTNLGTDQSQSVEPTRVSQLLVPHKVHAHSKSTAIIRDLRVLSFFFEAIGE